MAYYRGKRVMEIGVYRDNQIAPQEAGMTGAMHGRIDTFGQTASSLRQWIALADAMASALSEGADAQYAVLVDTGEWIAMHDSKELTDAPTTSFKVEVERTQVLTAHIEAHSMEHAVERALLMGKFDNPSADTIDNKVVTVLFCGEA